MKPALSRILVIAMAITAMAGCTRGTADVRAWVAQQKARKGAPLPPLPVVKTFETFVYQDQGMRDPFGPSAEETQTATNPKNGPHPDTNRSKEALEAFPLDSLKMVGTIGAGPTLEGLIQDPDGVVHQVHRNNYLGQNYGRITDITEDHIDLVELVPDGNGGWMERDATISLTST